jgi:hypothetical protein
VRRYLKGLFRRLIGSLDVGTPVLGDVVADVLKDHDVLPVTVQKLSQY